jgi:hypothetical protein
MCEIEIQKACDDINYTGDEESANTNALADERHTSLPLASSR